MLFTTAYNREYTDPNIIATATAFNIAYSYLMLLLQNAWGSDGHKKKTLVIGGMPALMHGVLRPIAEFLASKYSEFGFLARIIIYGYMIILLLANITRNFHFYRHKRGSYLWLL
jgi:hypothetical protein